jgi:hypothetical protein
VQRNILVNDEARAMQMSSRDLAISRRDVHWSSLPHRVLAPCGPEVSRQDRRNPNSMAAKPSVVRAKHHYAVSWLCTGIGSTPRPAILGSSGWRRNNGPRDRSCL